MPCFMSMLATSVTVTVLVTQLPNRDRITSTAATPARINSTNGGRRWPGSDAAAYDMQPPDRTGLVSPQPGPKLVRCRTSFGGGSVSTRIDRGGHATRGQGRVV